MVVKINIGKRKNQVVQIQKAGEQRLKATHSNLSVHV
jgi:hypothetical protein